MTLDAGMHDFLMAKEIAQLRRELAALRAHLAHAGIVVTPDGGIAFDATLEAEAESGTAVPSAGQPLSRTIRAACLAVLKN